MTIYLKHPDHGSKVTTDTPSEEEVIAAPVNTLEVKRRRKTIE